MLFDLLKVLVTIYALESGKMYILSWRWRLYVSERSL
jgi:hypothetical protein